MIKASLVTERHNEKNFIFNDIDKQDDLSDKFVKLKSYFDSHGFNLSTSDINSIESSEIVIYASEMPTILPKDKDIKKSFIILSESHFIKPSNFDKKKHKFFNLIFTWNDDLVDESKYIKLNLGRKFPKKINKDLSLKKKFCTMITTNKYPPYSYKNELYSKRIEIIRWFEKNHPNCFDLYGIGWDTYRISRPKILRLLNKSPLILKFLSKYFYKPFPSYRGRIDSKQKILEKYRFSICFENVKDIPGYISEKIFHSFFAGCVPIYLGANNILSYIPKNCFIDFRDFQDFNELFYFIKNMSDKTFSKYLDNIEIYMNSNQSKQFTSDKFADTVFNSIMKSINQKG